MGGAAATPMTKGPCGFPPIPPAPPPMGSTQAEIDADFPAYIIWQFQAAGAGGMEQTISSMEDKELWMLASFFLADHGDQATLQAYAAEELSATSLVRWQAAFTQALVNPYVGSFAPTPISLKYFSHPALHSIAHAVPPAPAPPVPDPLAKYGKSIQTQYLEWRTAPFKSCGVACALGKLAAVVGPEAAMSWKVGQQIGTTFYNTMVSIDPSYGYDLVVNGGGIMWEQNGLAKPPAAQGYFENGDGTFYDGYGNLIGTPNPTLNGLPAQPDYNPPYTFYDPYGDCLIGFLCAGMYP
jgi:hypothetical protein